MTASACDAFLIAVHAGQQQVLIAEAWNTMPPGVARPKMAPSRQFTTAIALLYLQGERVELSWLGLLELLELHYDTKLTS